MEILDRFSIGVIHFGILLCGMTFGHEFSRREILAYLFNSSSYDSHIAPDFDEEFATNVTLQITIHNIHSVSETSMEYSLGMYLRMWWRDDRLDYTAISNKTKLELDIKSMDSVWQPDVFFLNEKRASVHSVINTNKLMHIFKNGTIVYCVRLSLALSCTMMLHFYPFDTQFCPIYIESFGYTRDNINLNWHLTQPITADDIEMPQFHLLEDQIRISDSDSDYFAIGTFSTLKAELTLTRKVGFYFLQVFIPSILLVVLSWISFWVDPTAVPARVSLGVTCILTMTTQISGINQTLPPVSYVKAIDIWMFVCLLFVFAALLEFAYVNVLERRKVKEETNTKKPSCNGPNGTELKHITLDNTKDKTEETDRNEKQTKFHWIIKCLTAPLKKLSLYDLNDWNQRARKVDYISRFIFPSLFVLFLIVFFMVCGLHPSESVNRL